jgi:hypothetical protein
VDKIGGKGVRVKKIRRRFKVQGSKVNGFRCQHKVMGFSILTP